MPSTPRLLVIFSSLLVALSVSGCASGSPDGKTTARAPTQDAGTPPARTARATKTSATTAPGIPDLNTPPVWGQRFYLDDGPGDRPIAELDNIPDAVPRDEPVNPFTAKPYSVFGTDYTPLEQASGFRQKGLASWYGKRFHGKRTSSGEPYDMYAMTAAHPTLPIPSYARVTNVATGKSVVVRVNDRGPFHPGRIMDVSYAAAHRLGYASRGSAEVTVEALRPGEDPQAAASGLGLDPIPTRDDPAAPGRLEQAAARGKTGAPAPGELWLQLGAFGTRDNAENLKRSVAAKLPELAPGLTVAEIDGKWRLRLGPMYDRKAMDYARDVLREKMAIRGFAVKP